MRSCVVSLNIDLDRRIICFFLIITSYSRNPLVQRTGDFTDTHWYFWNEVTSGLMSDVWRPTIHDGLRLYLSTNSCHTIGECIQSRYVVSPMDLLKWPTVAVINKCIDRVLHARIFVWFSCSLHIIVRKNNDTVYVARDSYNTSIHSQESSDF